MKVVVIGGGVIGYSAALALAERGASVTVIDMRGPGAGATQAAAGMLAPYIEGHDETLRRLGVQSLALYDAFVHRLHATGAVEYARPGTLQVARSPHHVDELERNSARLRDQDAEHVLLTGEQVARMEPRLAADVLAGLFVPSHGYVHVGQLMSALTTRAAHGGVVTVIDQVIAVEPRHDGIDVVARGATVAASAVVIAAGSWSGALAIAGSPRIPVRPIKGQLLEVAYATPLLHRIVWSEDCYLVPWQSGSIIIGATVEDVGFDESTNEAAADALLASARGVLPDVERAVLRAARAGLRPATRDELPLVGWSSTMRGVCLAVGHYRNGILLAPLTAALVAEIVHGKESPETRWAREALDPSRMGL